MRKSQICGICVVVSMVVPSTVMAVNKTGSVKRGKVLTKSASVRSVLKDISDTKKWDVSVGSGVAVGPKYVGSDKTEAGILPMLDIVWNDLVYLNFAEGLGVYLYQDYNFFVSSSIGYGFGRDESDSKYLKGLGDIDGSLIWTTTLEYEFGPMSPYVNITKHFGGSDGIEGQIGIRSMIPLGLLTGDVSIADMGNLQKGDAEKLKAALLLGVSADWGNGDDMNTYWSVKKSQSLRSGLSQYNAEAGFKSVNVDFGIMYPIDDNWTVNLMVGYSRLVGDVADSPIVKTEDQVSAGIGEKSLKNRWNESKITAISKIFQLEATGCQAPADTNRSG